LTVCEPGVAESVKSGVTTRVTLAVCVSEPLVPVIVSVKVPVGVLVAVAILSVEPLPALTEVGLNVPVAPVGSPVTLRLIEPLNPPMALVLTV
jgi:hypothetical protein